MKWRCFAGAAGAGNVESKRFLDSKSSIVETLNFPSKWKELETCIQPKLRTSFAQNEKFLKLECFERWSTLLFPPVLSKISVPAQTENDFLYILPKFSVSPPLSQSILRSRAIWITPWRESVLGFYSWQLYRLEDLTLELLEQSWLPIWLQRPPSPSLPHLLPPPLKPWQA